VKVSLQDSTPIAKPLTVSGKPILEPGAPVVWFTFPDRWHDIGRFHRRDGEFTGFYANVLTPVDLHSRTSPIESPAQWRTTDLFLDVWMEAEGSPVVLDEDEWAHACRLGHITASVAARARAEADTLLADALQGRWPPPVVQEWTLEKARAS
jgi:predicted RNA-binding protein associated with RNAse of E/G family